VNAREKPFWNPYVAGIALGLVLLGSFVLTGRGLGASGTFKHVGAELVHRLDPSYAAENPNIAAFFTTPGRSSMNDWIVWISVGAAIGGAVSVFSARRFTLETIRGPRIARESRWVLAIVGGVLSGFAAQLARGCTSGQALTGGAELAAGSWVFMFSVFAGAYALAYVVRKQWI
jgi:uncharacterized protein